MIGGKNISRVLLVLIAVSMTTLGVATTVLAEEAEQAMWGNTTTRNMVSGEKGLPAEFDVKSGKNVKWSQVVGSQSYAGPVIAGGKVFVGTNNEGGRNPDVKGDKGVMMAFDVETGDFLWQMVHDKLRESKLHDWPLQGICATPAIDGDRLYYTSNRAEIACIDSQGFRDGENDGPVTDEKVQG
ncbi:MAG: PQQ-binding-like beta-propeller repeat protein, partial [Thermoanaerobaculia bacterium]